MTDLTKRYTLSFPLPPSANHCFPTNFATGRRYRSSEYEHWKKEAGFTILTQIKNQGGLETYPKGQNWAIDLRIYFTKEHFNKSDLDNRLKPTIDLLCSITGLKDRYLLGIIANKLAGEKGVVEASLSLCLPYQIL